MSPNSWIAGTNSGARIETDKSAAKADYDKRLVELEKKNSDLKRRIDEFKAAGKESWELFREQLNRDVNEVAKSIKELTT